MLLLVMAWFAAGMMIGFQARAQINQVTLVAINADQTQEAATATSFVTATEQFFATETQDQLDLLAQTPSPTATSTATATPTETPTLTPSPTGIGGSSGLIAFVSERDGDPEIFVLNPATGQQVQLTDNLSIDAGPSWSPDGRFIAYHEQPEPNVQLIYITDLDGNIIQLTEGIRFDNWPVWTSDGERVVFHSFDAGRSFIRSVTPAGEDETVIQQVPALQVAPISNLAPNNRLLTFFSLDPNGDREIITLDLVSNQRTVRTRGFGDIRFVSFSPDRSQLVYSSVIGVDNGTREIFLTEAGCTLINVPADCNIVQLTDDEFNYLRPRFSPDGTRILVASDRAGNFDLWTLDLEGGDFQQLTESLFDDYDGVFQPVLE
ncbi:MAG: hypothetical protein GYB68_19145 [Chloroflexi bacterium]|nr:hypothetical protein [Chloroflexota bacterium]